MGGKALNNHGVFTERKTTEEFNRIAQEIQCQIHNDFDDLLETEVVKCYHEKETHGDLDLLLKIDHNFHNRNVNLRKYVEETFKPTAIHNNGGVFSFDYDNFQVDFIPVKESNWDIANVYFSYDPLGNAMGKTFHKLNLSYGWDGLKYKYRNFNGRNSHDITITKDPRKIFEFGGYDYDRYLEGFDSIEEIFNFIINGDFFDAEMFKMENLSHIDRKRNRKRGSYHKFLEYIEKNAPDKAFKFKKKSEYLPLVAELFPEANLMEKLKKLDERNEINQQLNEKLNGRLIMEWIPGLEGKALGDVMRSYKESMGDKYEAIILANTIENIKHNFLGFYESFYGKK